MTRRVGGKRSRNRTASAAGGRSDGNSRTSSSSDSKETAADDPPSRRHLNRWDLRIRRGRNMFVPGVIAGIGAGGILQVPFLVMMDAPTAVYPVIGTIATAALGTIGIIYPARRR